MLGTTCRGEEYNMKTMKFCIDPNVYLSLQKIANPHFMPCPANLVLLKNSGFDNL